MSSRFRAGVAVVGSCLTPLSVLARATGLHVHPTKTVLVPVVPQKRVKDKKAQMRRWLADVAPLLAGVGVVPSERVFGFSSGPRAAEGEAWIAPLMRWDGRLRSVADAGMTTSLVAHFYHTTAVATLLAEVAVPHPPMGCILQPRRRRRVGIAVGRGVSSCGRVPLRMGNSTRMGAVHG